MRNGGRRCLTRLRELLRLAHRRARHGHGAAHPVPFNPKLESLYTPDAARVEKAVQNGEALLAVARVSESIHSLSMPKWGRR